MTDTAAAAAFAGAPVSALDIPAPPTSTTAPAPTPAPSGAVPEPPKSLRGAAKAAAAKKAAGTTGKRGRPRKQASAKVVADAGAEAAAAALEREARGPGRPSKADQQNDLLRAGLVNFYVGLGTMAKLGGAVTRVQRMSDVGTAMIVQAKPCADALVAAADQSPALRRALEAVALGGAASLVLAAHGPILMAALGQGAPETPADPSDPEQVEAFGMASMLGALGDLFANMPAA
jgi:hypothetical protein